MGLLFDEKLALENLVAILDRAARNSDPFVRIDMEGSAVVEATLRVFQQAWVALTANARSGAGSPLT